MPTLMTSTPWVISWNTVLSAREVVAALVDVAQLRRCRRSSIEPASGASWPTSIRNSVVLPAPLGPMIPTMPEPRQRERQVLDEQPVAVALAQALDLDDLVAEPRPGRDRDLELAGRVLRVVRLGEQLLVGATGGPCPSPGGPWRPCAPIRARGRASAGARRPSSARAPGARASARASSSSCRRTGCPRPRSSSRIHFATLSRK